jgi:hypothetical protein
MAAGKLRLNRALWALCVCLLLVSRLAFAAETSLRTRVSAEGRRAAAVGTWLSASHVGNVIEWTHHHMHLRSARSRVAFLFALMPTHRHGLDDGDAEGSDPVPLSTFAPVTPFLWPSPRGPDLVASSARAPHDPPACRSFCPDDPFLPRPPPAYVAF